MGNNQMNELTNLIFVDCEGHGPAPTLNDSGLFEFGAVSFGGQKFHGKGGLKETFIAFDEWLNQFKIFDKLVFMSDNPAYDWQFINYYFHLHLGRNPFGHSARRISDYYAGLVNDFHAGQKWKKLRITPHDHNPVRDALGNLEAFRRILNGER